jgi:FtsZ-interacting cell division protein ZipA
MAALRWILLLAGLVFLAALAAWELRRPRQARRVEPDAGHLEDASPAPPGSFRTALSLRPRKRLAPPPRVDFPPLDAPDVLDVPEAAVPEAGVPQDLDTTPVAAPMVLPLQSIEGDAAEVTEQPLPVDLTNSPIVEWPPEAQRHVICVRVVSLSPERLSGRPLRQALAACGFVHGRFGIFHQPGTDGRALISAANLSKPGVFDPISMDFQRFRGLGLFTVLPGPLPPAAALDHLLETASDLAQRLRARVQDEQGLTLDEARLEAMMRSVQNMGDGALRTEPAA